MLPWRALDVLTVLSSFRWSPRNSRLTRSCDHCFMLVRLELISSLDWKIHQLILRSTRPSTSWTSQRCHSETDIFQKKIESSVFGLVWVVTRFSFVIPLYCTPELYYWQLDFHSLSMYFCHQGSCSLATFLFIWTHTSIVKIEPDRETSFHFHVLVPVPEQIWRARSLAPSAAKAEQWGECSEPRVSSIGWVPFVSSSPFSAPSWQLIRLTWGSKSKQSLSLNLMWRFKRVSKVNLLLSWRKQCLSSDKAALKMKLSLKGVTRWTSSLLHVLDPFPVVLISQFRNWTWCPRDCQGLILSLIPPHRELGRQGLGMVVR